MEHKGTTTIETPRLILRRFTVDDAEAMYRNWASDEAVTRFLTWPVHADAGVSRAILEEWVAASGEPSYYQWAIELTGLGEVIGAVSVVRQDADTSCAELGWCIGRRWWNRGLMTEAAGAVRDYLFREVGFSRIEAKHDADNPASGRVMCKIGLLYEGTSPKSGVNNRGVVDLVRYGLTREAYESGVPAFRAMRRSAQQLDRAECEEILMRATSGVLAVYGDSGYPYTVPVSHVYKDGKIYFHCAKTGHKLDAIRRSDKVSFCVVDRDEVVPADRTTEFISVVAFGRARIVSDEAGLRYIAGLVGERFSGGYPDAVQREIDETIASDRLRCVEITVEHMTGKCAREIMARRRKAAQP